MQKQFTATYTGGVPNTKYLGAINSQDNNTYSIIFVMSDSGSLKINYELPDGTRNINEIDIVSSFTITNTLTAMKGMIKISPVIYDGDKKLICLPVLVAIK